MVLVSFFLYWTTKYFELFYNISLLFKVKDIFFYPTCALSDLLPGAKQKWSCLMKELLLPSFSFFYQNMKGPPSFPVNNFAKIDSAFICIFTFSRSHWLGQETPGEKPRKGLRLNLKPRLQCLKSKSNPKSVQSYIKSEAKAKVKTKSKAKSKTESRKFTFLWFFGYFV